MCFTRLEKIGRVHSFSFLDILIIQILKLLVVGQCFLALLFLQSVV